jgi:hypothetical protein
MGERLLGANLMRRHSYALSFFRGGLFPYDEGALTSRPETAWAQSASMPHVVHAERSRGSTEGVPYQLENANEEETAKYALGCRLGFGPDGRANGRATTEQWYASGRREGTA